MLDKSDREMRCWVVTSRLLSDIYTYRCDTKNQLTIFLTAEQCNHSHLIGTAQLSTGKRFLCIRKQKTESDVALENL